jgi:hypothetical protein
MDCEEIKEFLYDYATMGLEQGHRKEVEDHLKECEKCQSALNELKEALGVLNEWKPPEVPKGFKDKVMTQVKREAGFSTKPFIDRFFKPFYFKLPLEGLAVAAMIFLALTIYRGFVPELERGERGFQITTKTIEAKSPIIIETENLEKSFSKLKDMIQTYHGSLVRRRPAEGGMEVTFKVEKEQEENILKELSQLGKVHKMETGFKDSDGNIVIILRRK